MATAFMDPDGDELTFTATLADDSPLSEGLSFADNMITGAPTDVGELMIKVTAKDTDGLEFSQTFSLVTAVNLTTAFSDPDGGALTFTLAVERADDMAVDNFGLSVNDDGIIKGALTVEGTLTITVTATDPGGASSIQEFTLETNRPPMTTPDAPPPESVVLTTGSTNTDRLPIDVGGLVHRHRRDDRHH